MTEPVYQPVQSYLPPPGPPPPPRNRLVLVLAIALGFAVAGILTLVILLVTRSNGAPSTSTPTQAATPTKPSHFELTGSFSLNDGVTTLTSDGCAGRGGYSDIAAGALVTVYSSTGEVLATGKIEKPVYHSSTSSCEFRITVAAVPDGHDFYQVEVSHRGKIAVPSSKAKSGAVALTLG